MQSQGLTVKKKSTAILLVISLTSPDGTFDDLFLSRSDAAAASIGASGQFTVKIAMFLLPLIFIVAGYVIYLRKYKIDGPFYQQILADLEARGELHRGDGE